MTIKLYSRFTLNKMKRKKILYMQAVDTNQSRNVPVCDAYVDYYFISLTTVTVHVYSMYGGTLQLRSTYRGCMRSKLLCAVYFFLPFRRKAAKQLILYVLYGKWKCSRTRIFHVPLTVDRINRNGHGLSLSMHQTSAIGHASN